MGLFSALVSYLRGRKGAKVICVGLDNSGKTTLLNHLKPDEVCYLLNTQNVASSMYGYFTGQE